jgi:Group II intron, maturase-specific domain/Reverse transcriptase (RNA-dependent DNA polymerase)
MPHGPKGVRKLGIPAVLDRVCQQALVQRMAGIFAPTFLDGACGSRLWRSPHEARRKVWQELNAGYGWIVAADVRQCFDTIDHGQLLRLVQGLNRVIRGGRNYFRGGNSTKQLAALDRYVRLRLWLFLRKRHGPRGHLRPEGDAVWLRRSGLERFYPTGRGHVQPCMP